MLKRYAISQNTHGLEMPLSTGVNIDVCLSDDVEKLEAENERLKCCGNCKRLNWDSDGLWCPKKEISGRKDRCDRWESQI